jgi:hypothetical protein
MLTIMTLIIGTIVLTLAIVIGFVHMILRLADWLNKHYGVTIRRLTTRPQHNTSDDTGYAREQTDEGIYPANPIQEVHQPSKTSKQIDVVGINPMYRTSEKQEEKCNAKCYNASIKSLPRFHTPILNICRRRVNQSGKEPCSRQAMELGESQNDGLLPNNIVFPHKSAQSSQGVDINPA